MRPLDVGRVAGIGAEVPCESYLPLFNPIKNLDEGMSSNWFPNHKDKTYNQNLFNDNILTPENGYQVCDKEMLRRTILEQDAVFREQVRELHRLYNRQKELMDDLKKQHLYGCSVPNQTCPLSAKGKSVQLNFIMQDNQQSSFNYTRHGGGLNDKRLPFCSSSKSALKRNFNLQLPADMYVEDADNDYVMCGAKAENAVKLDMHPRNAQSNHFLVDLNDPAGDLFVEGTTCSDSSRLYRTKSSGEEAEGQLGNGPNGSFLHKELFMSKQREESTSSFFLNGDNGAGRCSHPYPSIFDLSCKDLRVPFGSTESKRMNAHDVCLGNRDLTETCFGDKIDRSSAEIFKGTSHQETQAPRVNHPIFAFDDRTCVRSESTTSTSWKKRGNGTTHDPVAVQALLCFNTTLLNVQRQRCENSQSRDHVNRKLLMDLNLNQQEISLGPQDTLDVQRDVVRKHAETSKGIFLLGTRTLNESVGLEELAFQTQTVFPKNQPSSSSIRENAVPGMAKDSFLHQLSDGVNRGILGYSLHNAMSHNAAICSPSYSCEPRASTNDMKGIDLNSAIMPMEDCWLSDIPTADAKAACCVELETCSYSKIPRMEKPVEPIPKPSHGNSCFPAIGWPNDTLLRVAAETIVSLSLDAHNPSVDVAESSNSLHWFAEVVTGDDRSEPLDDDDGFDLFESMTLKLQETKEVECTCKPWKQDRPDDDMGMAALLFTRRRRGQGRRRPRRQQRDFQKDVLPALASLSRLEVTEDLQALRGPRSMKVYARRGKGSNGCQGGAGRRQQGSLAIAVSGNDAGLQETQPPQDEIMKSRQSIMLSGRPTRRCQRQRC